MLFERKHSWVIFVAIAKSLGLHLRSLVRALLRVNPTLIELTSLFHLFKPCNLYPKKEKRQEDYFVSFFTSTGLSAFPQSHMMSCNRSTRVEDVPRTPEAQTAYKSSTPEDPETNMPGKSELSEFEQQRLANIAERDALLKKLTLESQSSGLFASPKTPGTNGAKPKKRPTPKVKTEEEAVTPRRTSSRLKGIAAESEVAKRKADDEYEAMREADRLKRMRRTDSFSQADMFVSGQKLSADSLIGVDVITKGVAKPYERTFGDDEIEKTTDKDLKALREEMNGLQLWESWDPQRNGYTLYVDNLPF